MVITSSFHNALIHSLVDMARENENIGIFEFIKLMISETNWKLSAGERAFGPSSVAQYVQKHIDGKYSYPLVSPHPGTLREKLYRNCLINIHDSLEGDLDWPEVSWFEMITYLIFIQTNCHHKGNTNSHDLCLTPESFLNFFFKSKSAFNPWEQWGRTDDSPQMDLIKETETEEFRGEWWVKAFEREKEELLMFHTLSPSSYIGIRFTTGWIVQGFNKNDGDIIPFGSVLNDLREYYGLPMLSGDYGLGCMSEKKNILFEIETENTSEGNSENEESDDEESDNEESDDEESDEEESDDEESDDEESDDEESDDEEDEANNIFLNCEFIIASIGFVMFNRWLHLKNKSNH